MIKSVKSLDVLISELTEQVGKKKYLNISINVDTIGSFHKCSVKCYKEFECDEIFFVTTQAEEVLKFLKIDIPKSNMKPNFKNLDEVLENRKEIRSLFQEFSLNKIVVMSDMVSFVFSPQYFTIQLRFFELDKKISYVLRVVSETKEVIYKTFKYYQDLIDFIENKKEILLDLQKELTDKFRNIEEN